VGAGVAAVGTGTGGWITRQRFQDPDRGYAEVDGLVPINHALNVSAASLGATATGLLLGALLTAR
jgi:hypothetical protein